MSIFSIIRKGRQQEKEHPRKYVEQEREGSERPTYRHARTHHIAGDALAGAPLSRRTGDRPRTAGEGRRERAMPSPRAFAPSGGVSSGLSNVMHPSANANPMVVTAQRYSYDDPRSGLSQCHRARVGVVYPVPDPTYIPEVSRTSPPKGTEADLAFKPGSSRTTMGPSRAPLRRADKGNGSTANSSNSISSQNGSGAKRPVRPVPVAPTTAPPMTPGTPARAAPASEGHHSRSSSATEVHRLHPRRRRLSDASIEKPLSGPPRRERPSSSPRDSRPPLSMRGFDSITPVRTFPLVSRPISQSEGIQSRSNMAPSPTSLDGSDSWASSSRTTSYNSRMTPSSSVSPTGSSDSCTSVPPSAAGDFVFPFTNESKPASDRGSRPPGTPTPGLPARPRRDAVKAESPRHGVQAHCPLTPATDPFRSDSKPKNYYPPKTTRFTNAMTDADTRPPSRSTRVTSWLTRRFSQSSRVSVEETPTTDRESTKGGETTKKDSGRKKLTKTKPAFLIINAQ